MAEASNISIGINRDFVISGGLSGLAYRTAVNIDTTGARLVHLALRDFPKARALEMTISDALSLFDEELNAARRDIQKALRRRPEGVPEGIKQTLVVRSILSAQSFSCVVKVDQIQRDLTLLSMSTNPNAFDISRKAGDRITTGLRTLESVVGEVIERLNSGYKKGAGRNKKTGDAKAQPTAVKADSAAKQKNTKAPKPAKAEDKAASKPPVNADPKSKAEPKPAQAQKLKQAAADNAGEKANSPAPVAKASAKAVTNEPAVADAGKSVEESTTTAAATDPKVSTKPESAAAGKATENDSAPADQVTKSEPTSIKAVKTGSA